jgi:hypothetical protein
MGKQAMRHSAVEDRGDYSTVHHALVTFKSLITDECGSNASIMGPDKIQLQPSGICQTADNTVRMDSVTEACDNTLARRNTHDYPISPVQ